MWRQLYKCMTFFSQFLFVIYIQFQCIIIWEKGVQIYVLIFLWRYSLWPIVWVNVDHMWKIPIWIRKQITLEFGLQMSLDIPARSISSISSFKVSISWSKFLPCWSKKMVKNWTWELVNRTELTNRGVRWRLLKGSKIKIVERDPMRWWWR